MCFAYTECINVSAVNKAMRHNSSKQCTHSHSLIWHPSRVADTPPLLPISRYCYCLFVADVCLCSEVLHPGGSRSSSGSGSM